MLKPKARASSKTLGRALQENAAGSAAEPQAQFSRAGKFGGNHRFTQDQSRNGKPGLAGGSVGVGRVETLGLQAIELRQLKAGRPAIEEDGLAQLIEDDPKDANARRRSGKRRRRRTIRVRAGGILQEGYRRVDQHDRQ